MLPAAHGAVFHLLAYSDFNNSILQRKNNNDYTSDASTFLYHFTVLKAF